MSRHTMLQGLAGVLLDWFDREARALPWRTPDGVPRDPYRVWLSEVMLQQTTIPHATPYYLEFTTRWPTVQDLASAPEADVMSAWAGLGYYARARNMLKCAQAVAAMGGFPKTQAALRALPGIGPYTAGAMAAIAFGEPAAAVDGNVERVFARLLALTGDWKDQKRRIARDVQALVPADRPGSFAEALMDLGATVCTPRRPACEACPLKPFCLARASGTPERYPVKPRKLASPKRFGIAYVLTDGSHVLLERRPQTGLLAGMLGLPTGAWGEASTPEAAPPADADWRPCGEVRHVFTHFDLRLTVLYADRSAPPTRGEWMPLDAAKGLPSVFAKALRVARGEINPARRR